MTEKPAKPANKPTGSAKPEVHRQKSTRGEISERAYFIHLEQGSHDELENWLRAERELAAA